MPSVDRIAALATLSESAAARGAAQGPTWSRFFLGLALSFSAGALVRHIAAEDGRKKV